MLRRAALWATLATVVLWHLAGPPAASAYSVAIRWTGTDSQGIAGYRLYVRSVGGSERAPIDIAQPRKDASGHFNASISDLEVETTYVFALSALGENGQESERSNEYSIGYEQAAAVVDSDHDGLTDAEEDRNRNVRHDAGETDRLVADSDGDAVPDGLESDFGSDPLDPASPSCMPLDFSSFRITGKGTATVAHDPAIDDLALTTTAARRRSTPMGVVYPQHGKEALANPLLITRVRDDGPFRIDIHARSAQGRLYRLRYDGRGKVDRMSRRRLRLSLGDHFTSERYESIGIDVAATIAAMDPGAVFAAIERVSVRGDMVMQRPRSCH